MKKTGIIYVATDTARNNRRYIGQTIQTLKERKRGEYNRCFQNAINDHDDQIEWKIVEEVPIEELDTMERLYIWGLDTIHPNGYNFESGGHKNKILSEETKRKLSKALKGKTVSKEARKNMSIAARNKAPPSQEARKNMSRAGKGRKFTEEHKRKMSKSQKGENNPIAKLNWNKVNEIRKKYVPVKYSYGMLAKEYNVSKSTIKDIIAYRTWKLSIDRPT